MLNAIKQEVTIQPDGIVALRSPELEPGLKADVIVILKETSHSAIKDAESNLRELLNNVATNKERMTLTYQKQIFLAVAPIEDIEVMKQLKSHINDYTGSTLETISVNEPLGNFLDKLISTKARLSLTYQDKVFLAAVPIEDAYLIEELEDCIDNADADDALKEEGSIPWEQVKKELGI